MTGPFFWLLVARKSKTSLNLESNKMAAISASTSVGSPAYKGQLFTWERSEY